MSDCRCAGAKIKAWQDHRDYCPVFMQGRIRQLENAPPVSKASLEMTGKYLPEPTLEEFRQWVIAKGHYPGITLLNSFQTYFDSKDRKVPH